jgi:hypothetical protein
MQSRRSFYRWFSLFSMLLLAACAAGEVQSRAGQQAGCDAIDEVDESQLAETSQALVNCTARPDTGYTDGRAFSITVIEVDGKPVERQTANHYVAMQRAAAAAGVSLRIGSGFRTNAEQQYFYSCYVNCNCNNCNLAARPGYSNHQSGSALDLNTSESGVLNWLNAHAAAYGFARTVSSEPWHWEWLGGGASVDVCGGAVGSDGCTATERANAAQFGCACVNHQASGGYCEGSGCTATERSNAAQFGCGCVDHQGAGGMCPGSGCTALEQNNAAKFGCECVDHKGEGGMCPGDGCTELERQNAAKFGCFCVDHQGSGGACPGSGCTAKETETCAASGQSCQGHACVP